MLIHRDRVAEPADVAEVDERGRCRIGVGKAQRQFVAVQVFVADVRRPPLTGERKRRRIAGASREVAQRDAHQLGEPAKSGRDELAERHQVLLVVAIGRAPLDAARQADHRVAVAAVVVAERHADQRGAARLGEVLAQRAQIAGRQLVQLRRQQGDRRLRRDHQLSAGLAHAVGQPRQVGGQLLDDELFVLRHVGLQQAHGHRGAGAAVRRGADQGGHSQQRQRQRADLGLPQRERAQCGQPGGDRADAQHAEPRRQHREWRVDVRIAGHDPGKAGKEPRARQFGEQPRRRKQRTVAPPHTAAPARHQRHGAREIERQCASQRQHRHDGKRSGQVAVAVHADEQPPHAGTEPAQAVSPAQQRRTCRPAMPHHVGEPGRTQQLQRPPCRVHDTAIVCNAPSPSETTGSAAMRSAGARCDARADRIDTLKRRALGAPTTP